MRLRKANLSERELNAFIEFMDKIVSNQASQDEILDIVSTKESKAESPHEKIKRIKDIFLTGDTMTGPDLKYLKYVLYTNFVTEVNMLYIILGQRRNYDYGCNKPTKNDKASFIRLLAIADILNKTNITAKSVNYKYSPITKIMIINAWNSVMGDKDKYTPTLDDYIDPTAFDTLNDIREEYWEEML